MSLTLLQIIQDCVDELGLGAQPTTVISNTEQNIVQLLAMAQTLGPELSAKHGWEEIESTFSWTTIAANQQGLLTAVFGSDYKRLVPNTMWDSSALRPIRPLTSEDYEDQLRSNVTGAWPSSYIAGGYFHLMPAPAAGRSVTGRYISTGWCENAVGTGQDRWADDTDVIRFDPTLYKLHLKTIWLQVKTLPYGEMQKRRDIYELNLVSQQTEHNVLDLAGADTRHRGNPAAQVGGRNWENLATNWEELG